MFGKILKISEGTVIVQNNGDASSSTDLMNTHVIFEEVDQRILGEVTEVNPTEIKINFLGEYINNKYVNGVIRKPLLTSKIRMINEQELASLIGLPGKDAFMLGTSSIYKKYRVYPKLNDFFANHLAIVGNSGSGKSCGVARIVQNIFSSKEFSSYNSNLFIFDAYGEYKTAFGTISDYNPNYSYKFISSNPKDASDFHLTIPVNIMELDDFALLLQAETHSQLSILERTIRLAKIFSVDSDETTKYKNHLIAKALLAVLFSNQTVSKKKNEIFTIIEVCHTADFDFATEIPGIGYTRSFSECFEIDSNGNFGESVLITEYILKHISDNTEEMKIPENAYYTLNDFAKALEFTLISEGFQNNEILYNESIILKVRLNSILSSNISHYFAGDKFYSPADYMNELVHINDKKAQIININLEDVDDIYAKIIVKILSRFFFENAKRQKDRATMPIHLFLEEAHRYIQKDNDTFLLGYNIFDRIAKEGRKYGVILDIITQRPVELSDTVVAQVSNFLIFKMTHPKDIKYIEEMLPNMSADIIDKQKILQSGTCVAFGSAFKIPMIVKMDLPNPMPNSSSCDIENVWNDKSVPTPAPNISLEETNNETIITPEPNKSVIENNNLDQKQNTVTPPRFTIEDLKNDIDTVNLMENANVMAEKLEKFNIPAPDNPHQDTFNEVTPTTITELSNNKFIFNTENAN